MYISSPLELGLQDAMLSPGLVGGVGSYCMVFLHTSVSQMLYISNSNNFNISSHATILRALLMVLIVRFLFKNILLSKPYEGEM